MNYQCDTCRGAGQLAPDDGGDMHLGGDCADCNGTGSLEFSDKADS